MDAVASYLIQMIVPAVVGALLWLLTKGLRRNRLTCKGLRAGPFREGALLLFFMFMAGLLALTLTPAGFWGSVLHGRRPFFPGPFRGGVNLVPFHRSWELFRYYQAHGFWNSILINFPGNILMFLPIGFFAALLSDKPRWWKGTLCTFGVSLFIEVFQLFVSRGTDVDDLILNTLGGLLGHWFFLVFRRVFPGVVQKCAKQRGMSLWT